MKVFLDANVLFSAAFPGGFIGRFLEILHKHAEVVTSHFREQFVAEWLLYERVHLKLKLFA